MSGPPWLLREVREILEIEKGSSVGDGKIVA